MCYFVYCCLPIVWFVADETLIVLLVWVVKHILADVGEARMIGNVCMGMVAVMACMAVCFVR